MSETNDSNRSEGQGALPPTVEEMAAECGRFEVHELLGYGGMGAVYRAKQESMGRMVALKVLLGAGNSAPGLAAMARPWLA